MTDNLWPEIKGPTNIKTPELILQEQGAHLLSNTDGVVEGRVVKHNACVNNEFGFDFLLSISSLGYSIRLISVTHGIDFYPAVIHSYIVGTVGNTDKKTVSGSYGLCEYLRELFASREVIREVVAMRDFAHNYFIGSKGQK